MNGRTREGTEWKVASLIIRFGRDGRVARYTGSILRRRIQPAESRVLFAHAAYGDCAPCAVPPQGGTRFIAPSFSWVKPAQFKSRPRSGRQGVSFSALSQTRATLCR